MRTRLSQIAAVTAVGLISALGAGHALAAEETGETRGGAAPAERSHLRIMLTNDDGWDAEGITTAYDALTAAGHDVTLVAPLGNNSGMGGRITLGGSLEVTQPEPDKYAVAGTPSDAAEFGMNTVFADNPPDLVVSGINKGQNLAAISIHSGTVAAASTAVNNGVPSIAISAGWDYADPDADPTTFPFDFTAEYLVDLVEELQESRPAGQPLLPDGTGLNVNYPYVDGGASRATGVKITESGSGYADLTYSDAALPAVGETSTFAVGADIFDSTERNADDVWFGRGYVTITPINGNYDAEGSMRSIRPLAGDLD